MNDQSALLHNMSSPPKSVVKYSGLIDLAINAAAEDDTATGGRHKSTHVFGTPVRFLLDECLQQASPAQIVAYLGIEPEIDAARQLARLINAEAKGLPFPDGCVVIASAWTNRPACSNALTTLAVLSKCSDSVWLRDKTPAIHAALARRKVTLLVPPNFASQLPERI